MILCFVALYSGWMDGIYCVLDKLDVDLISFMMTYRELCRRGLPMI